MYQYQVAEILQKLDMIIDFFKIAEPRSGTTGYAIQRALRDTIDIQSRGCYTNLCGDKEASKRQLDGRRKARKKEEEEGRVRFRRRGEYLREEPPTSPTFYPAESSSVGW